jgi:hypothetical protein
MNYQTPLSYFAIDPNHNQTIVRPAPGTSFNHNQTVVRVDLGREINHNQTLVRR